MCRRRACQHDFAVALNREAVTKRDRMSRGRLGHGLKGRNYPSVAIKTGVQSAVAVIPRHSEVAGNNKGARVYGIPSHDDPAIILDRDVPPNGAIVKTKVLERRHYFAIHLEIAIQLPVWQQASYRELCFTANRCFSSDNNPAVRLNGNAVTLVVASKIDKRPAKVVEAAVQRPIRGKTKDGAILINAHTKSCYENLAVVLNGDIGGLSGEQRSENANLCETGVRGFPIRVK